MSLVVEDGSGLENSEVYGELEDATEYLAKFGKTALADLATEAEQEAAMREGALYVDQTHGPQLPGERVTGAQAREWPREGASYTDGKEIGGDEVPPDYIHATFEAAELAAAGETLIDTTDAGQALKRKKIDVLEYEWFSPGTTKKTYHVIAGYLRRLLRPVGRIVRA